jgi:hypothetical protein
MPKNTQNKGPCVIIDCKSTVDVDKFRRITDIALKKLHEHPNWEDFNFLKLDDQLCFSHYMKYVEPTKRRRLEAKGHNEDNSEMENVNNNPSLRGININITEEGVLLSKEDFKLLVQKINNIELTIENNQKQIESLIETADICLTVQNDSRKSKLKLFVLLQRFLRVIR